MRVEAEPQWQRGRCPGSRPLLDGRPALSNLNINCQDLRVTSGTFCKTTKELSAKRNVPRNFLQNNKGTFCKTTSTSPRDLMQSGGTRYAHEPAAARRSERLSQN